MPPPAIGTLKTKCSFPLAANSGGISGDVEGAALDLPAIPAERAPSPIANQIWVLAAMLCGLARCRFQVSHRCRQRHARARMVIAG